MKPKTDEPPAAAPPKPRRVYEAPVLKRLGSVRDLTLAGAGSRADAIGSMMRTM